MSINSSCNCKISTLRRNLPAAPLTWHRFRTQTATAPSQQVFIGIITKHAFIDITDFSPEKRIMMPGSYITGVRAKGSRHTTNAHRATALTNFFLYFQFINFIRQQTANLFTFHIAYFLGIMRQFDCAQFCSISPASGEIGKTLAEMSIERYGAGDTMKNIRQIVLCPHIDPAKGEVMNNFNLHTPTRILFGKGASLVYANKFLTMLAY